jgi:hypothetical protein
MCQGWDFLAHALALGKSRTNLNIAVVLHDARAAKKEELRRMLGDSASKLLTLAQPPDLYDKIRRNQATVETELARVLRAGGDEAEQYAAAQKWVRVAFSLAIPGEMHAWARALAQAR